MDKKKYKEGPRKTFLIILIVLISLGLLLPSFMGLFYGLGF